jgi:hypothetical protein
MRGRWRGEERNWGMNGSREREVMLTIDVREFRHPRRHDAECYYIVLVCPHSTEKRETVK